jgi:hypothetical protein
MGGVRLNYVFGSIVLIRVNYLPVPVICTRCQLVVVLILLLARYTLVRFTLDRLQSFSWCGGGGHYHLGLGLVLFMSNVT